MTHAEFCGSEERGKHNPTQVYIIIGNNCAFNELLFYFYAPLLIYFRWNNFERIISKYRVIRNGCRGFNNLSYKYT